VRLTPARTLIAVAAALAPTSAVALAQEPLEAPTVRVAFSYSSDAPRIVFERFTIQGIPDGATVDVRCLTASGKRCRGALRRAFRRSGVSGTIEVRRFTNRRIRPGRKLVATIASPGYLTVYKTVTVTRRGAIPIVTECSQPGSTERGPC
jgi:hypothetical protein